MFAFAPISNLHSRISKRRGYLIKLTAVFLSLPLFSGCQPSGSGAVTPPRVMLSCSVAPCSSGGGQKFFVVYVTQAGCSNPEFEARYSASGHATCSGGTCTGLAEEWIDSSGEQQATIPVDTYDFCATIYLAGSPNSGSTSGDAAGTLENMNVNESGRSYTISTWAAVP